MEISLPRLPEPVTFRFFADFNMQIQSNEIAGFRTQQFNDSLTLTLFEIRLQAEG